ncbi:SusD-like starch-binding protein associating with outer membrane [Mucilaginibacter oryzae]|uniref:SusD-like starch-binding protein associating with outer membrane n=1 Tax=Mucilaginibacter oryzae TaxID=468058 RepID=A0A316H6N6_9SPHI|nr:RagB/SusD family nutrient uptake outer membrane protein [Mucilaginibacter oryzae]PWK72538.1 SusD-like starch-binding protein associating with outer membrane [Mucilaginibacter oryzae]
MKFWKLIPVVLLFFLFACKKNLTINLDNRTVAEGYYDSPQKFEQAAVGGYVDLRRALVANYAFLMYGEARTGDLAVATDYQPAVVSQKLTSDNRYVKQLTDWEYFYDVIHDANDLLDNINKADNSILNGYKRNLYKGEALALKSYAYFYMARIWGDIASAETNNFGKHLTNQEAVTLASGFASEAKRLLPWRLLNDSEIESAALTNIRFSKTSVTSLLAHEELWLGKAQDAYTLLTNTFTTATTDSLSDFGISMGVDRRTDIPQKPLDAGVVSMTIDSLNAIYPAGDSRRAGMFNISSDGKTATMIVADATILPLITKRELNLLFAEAAWRSGNLNAAKTYLIRAATGAKEDYSTLTDATFANALLKERRRMLVGTGQRVFDLIRLGKVSTYIPAFTDADVQKGAAYWPLSANSLKGSSLSQNSYWLSKK